MGDIPQRSYPVQGCPLSRAPQWLKPWLDCVDGAWFVGGTFRPDGTQSARVALCRGGLQVGQIEVEVPRVG